MAPLRRPRRVRAAVAAVLVVAATGCSDEPDEQAFCERLRGTAGVDALLDRFDAHDPAGSAAAFRDAADDLDALADDAPGEVDGELRLLADTVGALADGLATVGRDDPSGALAVLDRVSTDAAELERAGDAVARYAGERCGVALDGASTTTTVPVATSTPTTVTAPTTTPPSTAVRPSTTAPATTAAPSSTAPPATGTTAAP